MEFPAIGEKPMELPVVGERLAELPVFFLGNVVVVLGGDDDLVGLVESGAEPPSNCQFM